MLNPSYSELMTILNENNEDNKITSRYTIVLAAAKRARQLTDGAMPLCYATADKPVSIAVKEMYEGRLKIMDASEKDDYYRAIREQMLQESNLEDTF